MIDSQSRMAQSYGYVVCLIAVVVGLISITGLTNSLFDYADPVHSDRWSGGSDRPITSFGAYKRAYYERQPAPTRVPSADPASAKMALRDSIPDATLRQMYEEDRTGRIETVRFRALKSLVGSSLLLIASIVLFTIHWKWLRRQSAPRA